MIETSTRCIVCRKRVQLEDIDSRWMASCECSDYSIDAPIGIGATPEDALQEWGTKAATHATPLQPSALASFIVPPAPEGFVLTVEWFDGALGVQTATLGSLTSAQSYAQDRHPIHYGPREGQKAANQ